MVERAGQVFDDVTAPLETRPLNCSVICVVLAETPLELLGAARLRREDPRSRRASLVPVDSSSKTTRGCVLCKKPRIEETVTMVIPAICSRTGLVGICRSRCTNITARPSPPPRRLSPLSLPPRHLRLQPVMFLCHSKCSFFSRGEEQHASLAHVIPPTMRPLRS